MRIRSILTVLSFAVLAFAATSCREKPKWRSGPDSSTSVAVPVTSTTAPRPVSSAGVLNDVAVTESKQGPWTLRIASAGGIGAARGGYGTGVRGKGVGGGSDPSSIPGG